MTGRLSGKVALVTGASSGIGEGAALAFAAEGAKVAVMGRRQEKIDDLVARIAAAGGEALAVVGDVSVEADAFAAVEQTVRHFGRIDVLVNSAGVNDAGGLEALELDGWRRVIDINLWGTIYCCKAALPHMKGQGSGDIVNISSTSGRRGAAAFASYATSKFGLTGFTESLRQELGLAGVRVSIIEPGATATDIAESIRDEKVRDLIDQHCHKDGAMEVSDIVDGIMLVVCLPRRANVTRLLIQPTIDVAPMP